jgi:hypothetical protein
MDDALPVVPAWRTPPWPRHDADGQPVLTAAQVHDLAEYLIGADNLRGSCIAERLRDWHGAGAPEEAVYAWVLAVTDPQGDPS